MQKRIAVLIDGFNLFHSIQDMVKHGAATHEVKWLDLWRLGESFKAQVGGGKPADLVSVDYFSAFAHHKKNGDPGHVLRHETFVRALHKTGVKCHMHRFKPRFRDCKKCVGKIKFHEEKETDVAIAVKLLRIFVEDRADEVVIVSGDTDLAPAIKAVFEMFPAARISFAFPFARKNKELVALIGNRGVSFKLSPQSYKANLLPNPVIFRKGKLIHKPIAWV